jgi:hypothetical protein
VKNLEVIYQVKSKSAEFKEIKIKQGQPFGVGQG